MSPPFIFVGTHTLHEGSVDEFMQAFKELVDIVEAKEPQLIAFNAYMNEEGTEAAVVQIHPDVDSMAFHMQVAAEHIGASSRFLTTQRIDIYGAMNDIVRQMISQVTDVPVNVKPEPLGGFIRAGQQSTPTR